VGSRAAHEHGCASPSPQHGSPDAGWHSPGKPLLELLASVTAMNLANPLLKLTILSASTASRRGKIQKFTAWLPKYFIYPVAAPGTKA